MQDNYIDILIMICSFLMIYIKDSFGFLYGEYFADLSRIGSWGIPVFALAIILERYLPVSNNLNATRDQY